MTSPSEMRALAERYRRMAFSFTDRRVIDALRELAAEYELQAARSEAADAAYRTSKTKRCG